MKLTLLSLAATLATATDLLITLLERHYPAKHRVADIRHALTTYRNLTTKIVLQPGRGPAADATESAGYLEAIKSLAALPNVRLLGHVTVTQPAAEGEKPEGTGSADAHEGKGKTRDRDRAKDKPVLRPHQSLADEVRAWSGWADRGMPVHGIFLDQAPPMVGDAGDGSREGLRRLIGLVKADGDDDNGLRFGGEKGEVVGRVYNPRRDDRDGTLGDGGWMEKIWRAYEWAMGTRLRRPPQTGEVEGVVEYYDMVPAPDLVVGLEYNIGSLYQVALPDAEKWDVNRTVMSVYEPQDGKGQRPHPDTVELGLGFTIPKVVEKGFIGFLVDVVPPHIGLVTNLLSTANIGTELGIKGESLVELRC
ncbi:hypothetical protein MMYC01_204405 [Madurella mycetomatis]|uniref:Uncharacterized protein n=1 Tax=Madurella mycetomatis TaxID=100816 RepID=A0A175W4V3_9PEZI|nr:hypothetical protein MMYC01_206141 [Madurella mycetomatis]KXX78766.1 hypothetical protein MMYC01_204405 [Madurella mycetomatis]